MYEVELKLRADHDAVAPRLEERGSFRGEFLQIDTYYDAPHRRFAETDEALRVRRETGRERTTTRLTYKGPLVESESKTRAEYETAVDDADAIARILDALGFSPAATVEKERSIYAVDGYTVALDRVDGLGEFVEIEIGIEREAEDVSTAREGAYDVARALDLDPADQIRASYLGLLLENDAGGTGGAPVDPHDNSPE